MVKMESCDFGGRALSISKRLFKRTLVCSAFISWCLCFTASFAAFEFESNQVTTADVGSSESDSAAETKPSSKWRIQRTEPKTASPAAPIGSTLDAEPIVLSGSKPSMNSGARPATSAASTPPMIDRTHPLPLSSASLNVEDLRDEPTDRNRPTGACRNFRFEVGLLKPTIERLLKGCGYSIGQWALGDAEYEYDFEIPKSYTLAVAGVDALLNSIEVTYLIKGYRNDLDLTIDFEPSRGDVLRDMEIEQW